MASIFKSKGAKRYTILYFDENGDRRKRTGYTDKAETQRLANKLEDEARQRRDGLIDTAAERFAAQAKRAIGRHVDDFIATLEARKRDPKHVRTTRTYIERIVKQAQAEHLSDLTLSAVELVVGAIAEELKLSARAINAHTTAIKAFLRWAKKDNRIRTHDLDNIGKQNEEADRRYERRPLTEDELRTLIATTRTAPPWRGMSGVDRSVFYLVGAATGFRRSELGSLYPEDFDLTGPMPVIRLDGSRTKNGKCAEQPLLLNLATELKAWLVAKAPGRPIFALPEKTAKMLHADLRRCKIKPMDAKKRVVDCHSLRYAYISALARAGIPLKVAQTLARHSDPKLTMNIYAHLTPYDLHGAVADALPDLTSGSENADDTVAATGTFGTNATPNAPCVDAYSCNPVADEEVTSNRDLTLNQRVVGSSPTGGTRSGETSRT
jgi:integrase